MVSLEAWRLDSSHRQTTGELTLGVAGEWCMVEQAFLGAAFHFLDDISTPAIPLLRYVTTYSEPTGAAAPPRNGNPLYPDITLRISASSAAAPSRIFSAYRQTCRSLCRFSTPLILHLKITFCGQLLVFWSLGQAFLPSALITTIILAPCHYPRLDELEEKKKQSVCWTYDPRVLDLELRLDLLPGKSRMFSPLGCPLDTDLTGAGAWTLFFFSFCERGNHTLWVHLVVHEAGRGIIIPLPLALLDFFVSHALLLRRLELVGMRGCSRPMAVCTSEQHDDILLRSP